MLKPLGKSLRTNRIAAQFQTIQDIHQLQRENSNSRENPVRHHHNKVIKVNIMSKKPSQHYALLDMIHLKGPNTISGILKGGGKKKRKKYNLNLNMKKYQTSPK